MNKHTYSHVHQRNDCSDDEEEGKRAGRGPPIGHSHLVQSLATSSSKRTLNI